MQQSTISIVLKTLPYILLRFIVYMVFGLAFLLYMAVVVFVASSLGSLFPKAPPFVFLAGFIIMLPLQYYAREYLLYLVKAGHVAVITELVLKGQLPDGVSQISWGRSQVDSRFKEASALFAVDRLVHGVIRSINGIMWQMGQVFSFLPGSQSLIKLANLVLYFSLTYVDESILARNFVQKDEGIWQSAQKGVILYAQSWREILKSALICGAAALLVLPLLIFILMTPALALGAIWPSFKIAAIIGALFFALVLKSVFLDPWTLTYMISVYLKTTQGMAVDASWESKLEGVSSKFRKLKQKTVAAGATV